MNKMNRDNMDYQKKDLLMGISSISIICLTTILSFSVIFSFMKTDNKLCDDPTHTQCISIYKASEV